MTMLSWGQLIYVVEITFQNPETSIEKITLRRVEVATTSITPTEGLSAQHLNTHSKELHSLFRTIKETKGRTILKSSAHAVSFLSFPFLEFLFLIAAMFINLSIF